MRGAARAKELLRARRRGRVGRLARARLAARALRRRPTCATTCSTHGVMVETLETAAQWSQLLRGCTRAVARRDLDGRSRSRARPGLVMCHVSHVYETGASLYFTLLARQREGAGDRPVAGRQARRRGRDPSPRGATITHHHAIGRDHARWLAGEVGDGRRRGAAGG